MIALTWAFNCAAVDEEKVQCWKGEVGLRERKSRSTLVVKFDPLFKGLEFQRRCCKTLSVWRHKSLGERNPLKKHQVNALAVTTTFAVSVLP
jgi:hypothetical protein